MTPYKALPEEAAVYVLRNTGFGWERMARISCSCTSSRFGQAVAIDGQYILVGDPQDSEYGCGSRAAWFCEITEQGWGFGQRLHPWSCACGSCCSCSCGCSCSCWTQFNPLEDAAFGWSVDLRDGRAIVGAVGQKEYYQIEDGEYGWRWDASSYHGCGAAYVYGQNESGGWAELKKALPSDAAVSSSYGYSVAIEGNRALVGAPYRGSGGAAYILDGGESWAEEEILTRCGSGQFGYSVSLSGGMGVIGDPGKSSTYQSEGDAYVYAGSCWSCSGESLRSSYGCPAGAAYDRFGAAVAMRGSQLIVGMPEDSGSAPGPGKAVVFEAYQVGGSTYWGLVATLAAPAGSAYDNFGESVAVDGDYAIAGVHVSQEAHVCCNLELGRVSQTWELDQLGNWTSTTRNDATQVREHNAANEITSIDGYAGDVYYDAAGNMIVAPQLALPGYVPGAFYCTYDAWNRLVGFPTNAGRIGGGGSAGAVAGDLGSSTP